MSPWWLRPTSEGAANEEKDELQDKKEQDSPLPASHEGDVTARPAPHPDPADGPSAAAAAAVGSDPLSWAEPVTGPETDTSHQPPPPASPASSGYPEPYRALWQTLEESPAREAAAPRGWQVSVTEPAPEAAGLAGEAFGPGAAAGAAAAPAGAGRGPRPLGAQPSLSFQPAEQRPIEALPAGSAAAAVPAAPAADGEADADAEGESEERDGESRPEARKKRSRRSRGGRRKNGRAAASVPGAEPADDDDDDLDDEMPAQFPVPPPAVVPQPFVPRAARGGESYVISGSDLENMGREIIISVPDRQRPQHEERKIAVFCDFENIALGVRDSEISKFDIGLILERLLEKGKIIVKKAYADWERYSDYKRPFHEAAIELIDIPQKFYSGKNSADIKMVVDAMDLSYSKEHLDTFVILSGDSDFSPLVSKLKENNKYVIGIGVKNSSSNLLVDNCDEFIYYEDIWRDAQKGPKLDGLSKKTAEAFSLMVESIQALVRENKDVLWGSMIKQTMQRKKPSFNEGYYGYSTFSELLEDAERKNIVKLKKDQRSGTYIVTGFAKSGDAGPGRRQA